MDSSILELKGVGPATAELLAEAGFVSAASVASARPGALAAVWGIGPVRAASLQTEAGRLLARSRPASPAVAGGTPPDQGSKTKPKKAKKTKPTKKAKPTKKTKKAKKTKPTKKAKKARS